MTAEQVNEELQHRRSVAAAAREDVKEEAEAAAEPAAAAPAGGVRDRLTAPMDAGNSGAGVVLGVLVWVVVRNYLEGGMPQVRRLLRAKFLNDVAGEGA